MKLKPGFYVILAKKRIRLIQPAPRAHRGLLSGKISAVLTVTTWAWITLHWQYYMLATFKWTYTIYNM